MNITNNVALAPYTTMRLGGIANALTTVTSVNELQQAVKWAQEHSAPILVLGGGSNVIFSKGWDGLVIINRIAGFTAHTNADSSVLLQIGAGEAWDDIVARSVDTGLHGIEYLSAIPGTTGATPVQNVGAYGAQISDVLVDVEALDTTTNTLVKISHADCHFSYRHSIFKSPKNRRYIITQVTLRLTKDNPKPPFYASLEKYLQDNNITAYTPTTIRQAVVAIRAIKLPDPRKIANCGSFFKNPIIAKNTAKKLQKLYPNIVGWDTADGYVKISAGWLLENADLKGYSQYGFATHQHHALVIVNQHATTYDSLAKFRQHIINTVHKKFGITLQQEPEQF